MFWGISDECIFFFFKPIKHPLFCSLNCFGKLKKQIDVMIFHEGFVVYCELSTCILNELSIEYLCISCGAETFINYLYLCDL